MRRRILTCMGTPAKDGELRWDEPAGTHPDKRPLQPVQGPVTLGQQPPAARPPAGAPAPPQPPARPPAPYQAPYSPHGYVPPAYQPRPHARRSDGFSSTLEQWQTNRESLLTRDQHESELKRSLDRVPEPALQPASVPAPHAALQPTPGPPAGSPPRCATAASVSSRRASTPIPGRPCSPSPAERWSSCRARISPGGSMHHPRFVPSRPLPYSASGGSPKRST